MWGFIVVIFCFVLVKVTSLNILINNVTAFVWFWKKKKKKKKKKNMNKKMITDYNSYFYRA